ncbi:hypothetical protein B0T26DRAFT_750714 [Lasiosphaeria miniovina]|uniref:Uncharacterized protein n=1 Tax=Lasiosphaeria miniovina TaxID=1954250 RepID=A0AA40E3A0_9PEZI|nr:uncharacterized protein B0T26DRAFT_750714 [Lasiosphaeria miniovina]KAK0723442.1 hypothetical protein B0T26DRAFT_750714 [Lasiosphaeria miniovina]
MSGKADKKAGLATQIKGVARPRDGSKSNSPKSAPSGPKLYRDRDYVAKNSSPALINSAPANGPNGRGYSSNYGQSGPQPSSASTGAGNSANMSLAGWLRQGMGMHSVQDLKPVRCLGRHGPKCRTCGKNGLDCNGLCPQKDLEAWEIADVLSANFSKMAVFDMAKDTTQTDSIIAYYGRQQFPNGVDFNALLDPIDIEYLDRNREVLFHESGAVFERLSGFGNPNNTQFRRLIDEYIDREDYAHASGQVFSPAKYPHLGIVKKLRARWKKLYPVQFFLKRIWNKKEKTIFFQQQARKEKQAAEREKALLPAVSENDDDDLFADNYLAKHGDHFDAAYFAALSKEENAELPKEQKREEQVATNKEEKKEELGKDNKEKATLLPPKFAARAKDKQAAQAPADGDASERRPVHSGTKKREARASQQGPYGKGEEIYETGRIIWSCCQAVVGEGDNICDEERLLAKFATPAALRRISTNSGRSEALNGSSLITRTATIAAGSREPRRT